MCCRFLGGKDQRRGRWRRKRRGPFGPKTCCRRAWLRTHQGSQTPPAPSGQGMNGHSLWGPTEPLVPVWGQWGGGTLSGTAIPHLGISMVIPARLFSASLSRGHRERARPALVVLSEKHYRLTNPGELMGQGPEPPPCLCLEFREICQALDVTAAQKTGVW